MQSTITFERFGCKLLVLILCASCFAMKENKTTGTNPANFSGNITNLYARSADGMNIPGILSPNSSAELPQYDKYGVKDRCLHPPGAEYVGLTQDGNLRNVRVLEDLKSGKVVFATNILGSKVLRTDLMEYFMHVYKEDSEDLVLDYTVIASAVDALTSNTFQVILPANFEFSGKCAVKIDSVIRFVREISRDVDTKRTKIIFEIASYRIASPKTFDENAIFLNAFHNCDPKIFKTKVVGLLLQNPPGRQCT